MFDSVIWILGAHFWISLCLLCILFPGFCFLFSESDVCMLPVVLICSDTMFTGNSCWCLRLGHWNELGQEGWSWRSLWSTEGRIREERWNKNKNRFSVAELVRRLKGLCLMSNRKTVWLSSTYLLTWKSDHWLSRLSRGCLLELWAGNQIWVEEEE